MLLLQQADRGQDRREPRVQLDERENDIRDYGLVFKIKIGKKIVIKVFNNLVPIPNPFANGLV
jgi:hypothetical protein